MNGAVLELYWNMELAAYLFLGGYILLNLYYVYCWMKAYRRLIGFRR